MPGGLAPRDPASRRGTHRSLISRWRVCPPDRVRVGSIALVDGRIDPERLRELGDQHPRVPPVAGSVLGSHGSAGQSCPTGRSTLDGEPGTTGEHIPHREHDAQVAAVGPLDGVVQPVVGGADDDSAQRPERPGKVGVRECAETDVASDEHRGHPPVSHQGDHRDGGQEEAGDVAERVGPERREDTQLLLGVVQGMQPPQGGEPMVGPMSQPVGPIHEDDGDRKQQPPGPRGRPRGLDPPGLATEQMSKGHPEEGHEWNDGNHVEDEEGGIVEVPAGEHLPTLGRPAPFTDERHRNHRQDYRGDEFRPAGRQDGSQAAVSLDRADADPQEPSRAACQDEGRQVEPSTPRAHPGGGPSERRQRRLPQRPRGNRHQVDPRLEGSRHPLVAIAAAWLGRRG